MTKETSYTAERKRRTRNMLRSLRGITLKPCPFCGNNPEAVPWHGGGPRVTRVSCVGEECAVTPSTVGSTPREAVASWNRRDGEPWFR